MANFRPHSLIRLSYVHLLRTFRHDLRGRIAVSLPCRGMARLLALTLNTLADIMLTAKSSSQYPC